MMTSDRNYTEAEREAAAAGINLRIFEPRVETPPQEEPNIKSESMDEEWIIAPTSEELVSDTHSKSLQEMPTNEISTQEMPSKDKSSQEITSQEMPFKDKSSQEMHSEDKSSQEMTSPEMPSRGVEEIPTQESPSVQVPTSRKAIPKVLIRKAVTINKIISQPVLSIKSENNSINTSIEEPMAVDTPKKRTITKIEKTDCDSGKKYNLRPKSQSKWSRSFNEEVSVGLTHRPKKVKYQANLPKWIPRLETEDFRDRILTEVDTQAYHPKAEDDFVEKVINITSISSRSQLDSFVYSSKKFIAICWLTSMRIFEYLPDKNLYLEVKRIPHRYITISPQLLTSVHCDSDQNFYLAYLWGCQRDEADTKRSYLEIRDINGNLLMDEPIYYEDVVKEIYSDNIYIYVKLCSNVIYLHRKNFFKSILLRIDFTDESTEIHLNSAITSFWVTTSSFDSFTKLVMLTATQSQLQVSAYDYYNHKLLDREESSNFTVVSIEKCKRDIIIHRNTTSPSPMDEYPSKVDIGRLNVKSYKFESHINLSLQYYILQVKVHKENIYLFGYRENRDGTKFFEIGCLSMKDPKQKWTTYLNANGLDNNTQILIHSDNIAIIKSNQQVSCISTVSRERYECRCCKLSFLKKEDKLKHEDTSLNSMFGSRFELKQIQPPPKRILRKQSLEIINSSSMEENCQNGE